MRLLYARGVGRGNPKGQISDISRSATCCAGERDGEGSKVVSRLEGGAHVPAVPGGGNSDDQVVFTAERVDLPAEDLVVAVVICDSCENGGVGGKCDGREALPLSPEPSDQLRGQVLGVCGAAAVAAPKYFVTGEDGPGHFGGDTFKVGALGAKGLDHG